ncbi:MAG: 6-carboxytetrahydropterin synthase [Phycisphaerales bacterium]
MRGLGRYYEIEAVCIGEPDPRTGYLVNIKDVDLAVRSAVVTLIERACHERPHIEPAEIMWVLFQCCEKALPVPLSSLRWHLTPTYSVEVTSAAPSSRVVMRQRFDLAAAHRLHVPALSDEQNRQTFGRCNNPSGHGHNYRVEPAVAIDPDSGNPFTVADLERLTAEAIVEPFDHTHLNKDTAPFAEFGGLNPSVENIARVFFERLQAALRHERQDVELVSMTVWETDRTSCTYGGSAKA